MLQAAHLLVYVLQHLCALLQAKDDVLLYLRKLDARRQLLQLLQLRVRLGQQRLLVLFAPQREQRLGLVALGQHLLGNVRLLVRQNRYAPLVLVQLVALVLHVEDRPAKARGAPVVSENGSRDQRPAGSSERRAGALVLGGHFAVIAAHGER